MLTPARSREVVQNWKTHVTVKCASELYVDICTFHLMGGIMYLLVMANKLGF